MFEIFKEFCRFVCRHEFAAKNDEIAVLEEYGKIVKSQVQSRDTSIHDLEAQLSAARDELIALQRYHCEFVMSVEVPDYEIEGYAMDSIYLQKVKENFRRKIVRLKAEIEKLKSKSTITFSSLTPLPHPCGILFDIKDPKY